MSILREICGNRSIAKSRFSFHEIGNRLTRVLTRDEGARARILRHFLSILHSANSSGIVFGQQTVAIIARNDHSDSIEPNRKTLRENGISNAAALQKLFRLQNKKLHFFSFFLFFSRYRRFSFFCNNVCFTIEHSTLFEFDA